MKTLTVEPGFKAWIESLETKEKSAQVDQLSKRRARTYQGVQRAKVMLLNQG